MWKSILSVPHHHRISTSPDIAISEVSECLQGHHTRSVFLDVLFVFCQLWVKCYISDLVDTLIHT